ncbi:MAG TPA: hexitol phosphatase HxpB [Flavobacteriales bacterium]|nr:hexitol phosphatase HxpB [Flavobacteriales bacterium]|tara:strand:+ start:9442 stop:10107 length:666 start_codon:yes stop_codon:yes gene_type:complete
MDRKLNSTIKAVIFDMDGVLIDSEPLWRKAEIETFNELGFDFTDEMCRQTMGMRTKEVIEYWHNVLQWKNKSIDEVTQILLDKIHQSIQEEGVPMEGVHDIIDYFQKLGLPLAMASSSPYSLIDLVLEKLAIKHAFKVVESAEFLPYGKPHPQIFLNAAGKLNVNPHSCMVIEDSFHGMIAGKAANMFTVVIPEKEKFDTGKWCVADIKAHSLKDLLKISF